MKEPSARPPKSVVAVCSILDGLSVSYRVSENSPAFSCADAAAKRCRNGRIGIPLRDELKSVVFLCDHATAPRFVIAHCEGNRRIKQKRLSGMLGTKARLRLAPPSVLFEVLHMQFGTVNPFEAMACQEALQVFDSNLLDRDACHRYMMTNAGEVNWGVDFDVIAFANAIKAKRLGYFAT